MGKNEYERTTFDYVVMLIVFFIVLTAIYFFRRRIFVPYRGAWWMYISAMNFWYLFYKLVVSFFYRPIKKEKPDKITLSIDDMLIGNYVDKTQEEFKKVSAVLPCYNESKESVLNAIESLVSQDYKLHEIIFVDDGSPDRTAYETLKRIEIENNGFYRGIRFIVHRLHQNAGKKHAQSWGFINATGEFILSVDSDGNLFPDSVRELITPFEDEKVGSVVGFVGVRNAKRNFLARMQELSYYSSFNVGRATQSMSGNVLVCAGALSMHRREIVINHLDEFLKPRVMGLSCISGDDRRLTYLSKKYGYKTKYQSTAVCVTEVPETAKKYIKQRSRWLRSSLLNSLRNLKHIPQFPIYSIQSFLEGYLWLMCLIINICIVLIFGIGVITQELIISALIYYILAAYLSKIYFCTKNPLMYLLSPIYSTCYAIFNFIIRANTIIKMPKQQVWGTR